MDVVRGRDHSMDFNRLYHKGEAFRLLNLALREPLKQIGDDQLMAMAGLAVYDSDIVPVDKT